MLENPSDDFGSLLHVPPHGPCGAFGAGQPCHSTFFFEIRWVKRFRARLRTLGRGKSGVKRPTCRIRVAMCGPAKTNERRVSSHENIRFRNKQRGSFRSLPALSMPAAAVVLCDVPRCPGYPASILRPTCSCGDNVHGNCRFGHVCCATIVTR